MGYGTLPLDLDLTLTLLGAQYLSSLFELYKLVHLLRSTDQNFLALLPFITSEFGRRTFGYCALSVWNDLCTHVHIHCHTQISS